MEPDINPQSIPPTAPQAPIQPPVPEKSSSPILLLLILALVGVTSYFGYQNWQLKQQISKVPPTPTPLIAPTTIPDPTANWKTYTNEELKLTFKLPQELTTPGVFLRTQTPTAKGTQICWALDQKQGLQIVKQVFAGGGSCYLNKFTLGITSPDHEAGRMGGFADYKSFNPHADIPPALITRTTNSQNIEMIIIKGANGPKEDPMTKSGFPINGTPGEENIGALIKNNNLNYPVISVQMTLTDQLTDTVFNQILSTFQFINSKSEIPSSINKIFMAVNQAFGRNIVPTKENQFYSLKGFVSQESWKLDVSSLLTDKSQFTILFNTLEKNLKQDINSAADGIGQNVQGYENDQIYCFLLRGFNASDYISCVEK
ncbi:MAG: hypothetical protein WCT77_10255 [Bacteroidota bacterium]